MPTNWDPATVSLVTLSGSNLVATNTGTTSVNQGAHVPTADAKSSGKYYFECTITTLTGGGGVGVGAGLVSASFSTMSQTPNGVMAYIGNSGNIWNNAGNTGISLGPRANGDIIGVAVDCTNSKFWVRVAPSGFWNGNSAADPTQPVTGNGQGLPAGTISPFITFGSGLVGPTGASGNVFTANFGGSAFSGAVPSGYTAGWSAAAGAGAAQARAMVLA